MQLTWLYVPGDRPDRFAKAVSSGADAVILDLEDAVAAPRKAYARAAVAEFVGSTHPVPIQVRVNELTGPDLSADLEAVIGAPGLAGLRLPKVESPESLLSVAARVNPAGARAAGRYLGPPLHALIESAVGLEAAYAIAAAHPAVASIGLGEADLRSDLGVAGDEGLLWARSRVVVAARAAGLAPPAMSVYANVTDTDGLAASCVVGRRLGFIGRTAIHPRQLPIIVEAFRPAADELSRARELLAAVAEAHTRDSGTVVLPDGRFADRAMVAAAQRTVDLATRHGTAA